MATAPDALTPLVTQFFSVFCNKNGKVVHLETLHDLFLPGAVIVKLLGDDLEVFSLDNFIKPRKLLLTDGTLQDFEEAEIRHQTQLASKVAQRLSLYKKSGRFQGQSFETFGIKIMQCVHTPSGWRFSAVAWQDEGPGFDPHQAFVNRNHLPD